MTHAKRNAIVDVVALLVYLIVANPSITGIAIHEWLGIALIVVFIVHAVMHFDIVVDIIKDKRTKPSVARQGNLAVDILILITFMVVTVSGLGISGAVLPAFGVYAEGYYFWAPLHSISAKALLALFIIHIALHWRWIYRVARGERDADASAGQAS